MYINHLATATCGITSPFLKISGWALLVATAASVQGALVNPGFTDGLTGWQSDNTSYRFAGASTATLLANAVTSHQPSEGGLPETYHAPAGSQFLLLQAGPREEWVTVSQSVYLGANQSIGGFAAFSGWDDYPFNDQAAVWVSNPGGTKSYIWQRDISQVGDQGHSPWEAWKFTAQDPGTYTLVFGVKNVGDPEGTVGDPESFLTEEKFASYGLFTAVPEPSTWVGGVAAGMLTLCYGLRPRRHQQAT